MPQGLQRRIEKYGSFLIYPKPPRKLSKKFREIDEASCNRLRQSLITHVFSNHWSGNGAAYLTTDAGRDELLGYLYRRLEYDRRVYVPWLDHVKTIDGCKVLEIGCGTGASTVALAEQGARVIGLDPDAKALAVAQERCEIYGLDVPFVCANATDVQHLFQDEHFDFIIFFASLEHLTLKERISAIRDTWNMLGDGGLWSVIEAPNRLWWHDIHSSQAPFFMWLPDDLAFEYSRFSPRTGYSEVFRDVTDETMLAFLRRGRGVSFHEFELSIAPVAELNIVSDLCSYYRKQSVRYWLFHRMTYYRFSSFLSKASPAASHGFNEMMLNIILKKGH